MKSENDSIQMLEIAANALAPLLNEVAFIGGAVASLYVASETATPVRPTEDIDCVIEISSQIAYSELEKKLRNLGFKHDMTSKLICRWDINGIKIDIMPIDPKILGFTNSWYLSGFQSREKYVLPSGTVIYIFPLAYFIASKFEALQSRGGNDWRLAHDLEDILLVLDGCNKPLQNLATSPLDVKEFLSNAAIHLLKLQNLEEILHAHLALEEATSITKVRQIIIEMSKMIKIFNFKSSQETLLRKQSNSRGKQE